MRFTKHILPSLLVLAMLTAALVGCSGGSDTETTAATSTEKVTEQATEKVPETGAEQRGESATATEPVIETETETETETRPAEPSEGLEYGISEDGNSYIVTGIGSCADTDIVIPAEYGGKPVTSIGLGFSYCTGLTSITIPDSVTYIGDREFSGCTGLTSITIPDSVTSIGDYAFSDCSGLTSISIPDSVTSIGSRAFSDTAYYNDESNWTDGFLYIGSALIECKSNKKGAVTIEGGTTCIAGSAFRDCTGLTSIVIPDSVISIGYRAFYGCRSLTSISIPDSVTSIGGSAFIYCYGLTSITIPDSVTSIGDHAFYDCSGLMDINFNGTKAQWNAISKGDSWDSDIPYTIHCTDGDLRPRFFMVGG